MKYKRFHSYKNLTICVFVFTVFFVITGCSTKYPVTVLNNGNESYTALKINNPFGNAVTISAGSETGAIGYELNNDTIWLKGQPEILLESDTVASYSWNSENGKVVLKIKIKGNDREFTFKLDSPAGEPSKWFFNIAAGEDEYFTGVFERVVDGNQNESWKKGITTGLDLRGEKVDVKLKPTVSAYSPFYLSSANYGISVRGTWPGVIDFCRENPGLVKIAFEGPQLEFVLMTDQSPAEIVKRHTLETGPPVKLPKWAFGPWRWRDDHYNRKTYFDGSKVTAPYNSDVVEDIVMMKAYGIPCTAYWIDRPWAVGSFGFDDYEVDENRLPNFEKMVSWLNGQDIKLMMWIAPWVMGNMADEAKAKGYSLKTKGPQNQNQVLIDFTNPDACKWWGENGPGKLAKMGIKGFKLDRADGEILCDSLHLITASGITYRENYNDYPHQYIKATYEAVKPVLGNDFVLFPRAMYTGSSRYGSMWGGDTDNSQEGLRSVVIGVQRCAVNGYPFWTSDTGGYPKRINRETTMRWLGFSCFSPIMEVGPTNNYGFWGMNYEPSFDKELLAVWRFYANLRTSLVDYIFSMANKASETGMPVVRPLFLEYPDQKESWENWETYKFGDDLLVSVIWEEGKTSQRVYLPDGETWVDMWNNRECEGGEYVEVNAPLYQIPLFIRKGSSLVLPDLNQLYEESVAATSVKYKMSDLEAKEIWMK